MNTKSKIILASLLAGFGVMSAIADDHSAKSEVKSDEAHSNAVVENRHERKELPEHVKSEIKEYKAKVRELKENLSAEAKDAMQKRYKKWKRHKNHDSAEYNDNGESSMNEGENHEDASKHEMPVTPKAPELPVERK